VVLGTTRRIWEKEEIIHVKKSSILGLGEESQGGNDKAVCPYCFVIYQDGRTYHSFGGLFRHQKSAN